MLRIFKSVLCLCLAAGMFSCTQDYEFHLAPPQKVNDPTNNTGGGTGGGGTGGGSTDSDEARLARLGRTPIVCVYLTEYTPTSQLPDATEIRYFTHINYGHVRFVDKKNGTGLEIANTEHLKKLVALKEGYPELKILLMIGGWGKNADGFSMMARDPEKRQAFCQNCLNFCVEYNVDGVDLDWEYPGYGAKDGDYINGYSTQDQANFTILVKELREALGPNRLISYAASDSGKYMDHKACLEYVDYLNVMTYSMGDPPSRHNSPLYKSFQNPRGGAETMDMFFAMGIPYNRMNYGIAYYGHGDGNVYPSSVQYYRINQILTQGTWTDDKGNLHSVAGYNKRWWDAAGMVPYLGDASGKMYASYEDPESVAIKMTYIKSKGLLGAFGWEYREDEDTGTLRHLVYTSLHGQP